MHQRLAAGDDHVAAGVLAGGGHQVGHRLARVGIGIPRLLYVAPHAAHVAAAEANKVGRPPGVKAFALNSIKLLHYRKH